MRFLLHIFRFWLVLVAGAFGAYVLLYNRDFIYVNLPGIGEFKVMTALAFIICFLIGATVVCVHFAFDALKKSFEIRRLGKRVRKLQIELGGPDRKESAAPGRPQPWLSWGQDKRVPVEPSVGDDD